LNICIDSLSDSPDIRNILIVKRVLFHVGKWLEDARLLLSGQSWADVGDFNSHVNSVIFLLLT
jgi:hypothetical protein